LPKKTYQLNDAALADLATIQALSRMTETAAIHIALRNLAEMVSRGLPVYYSSLPEGPEPPTSAPSAARGRTLRVVEKPHGTRRTPPAKGPANTKQRKK
jgi:hypothetical protein